MVEWCLSTSPLESFFKDSLRTPHLESVGFELFRASPYPSPRGEALHFSITLVSQQHCRYSDALRHPRLQSVSARSRGLRAARGLTAVLAPTPPSSLTRHTGSPTKQLMSVDFVLHRRETAHVLARLRMSVNTLYTCQHLCSGPFAHMMGQSWRRGAKKRNQGHFGVLSAAILLCSAKADAA